jgi:hypothetical protein
MRHKNYILLVILYSCFNCAKHNNEPPFEDDKNTFFTSIPESHSKIDFENNVEESLDFNFLNYTYIYNGGGVAVGDINNDGLEDIYFVSNQETNKLYLNQGNFVFEDITITAKVQDDKGWSTGVTMVDINNDGWLDIYVCKSGSLTNLAYRQNKLFINQKDNTFKEEAAKYRLNLSDYSVQSYFFDYDKDGDLDMYLVNHRPDFNNNTAITSQTQRHLTLDGSDHLLRNDDGRFFNVTRKSGVANKAWGLSASIGDFNNDNWPDIYVANDFWEPDLLYINNQDGTFSESVKTYFKHISTNSMGSDFADINNDMFPDLVVLDMMAADRKRGKENMATMSTENFNLMVNAGYHHQYMSNMLQLNNGEGAFSEIGQLAGIAKTDWSWAPLIADFNNDGFNDLFVTNGIEKDLSNQDFRNKMRQNIMNRKKVSLEEAIGMMPSTKLTNYMFINSSDLTFKDVSSDFGFDAKVNSNGAAYADFDNDGDLDLVLNNQSDKVSIYRNNCKSNYITITLEGTENNKKGIGAKVEVYTNGNQQMKAVYPSRGYQSSVSYNLNFGLGNAKIVDSIKVVWNDNKSEILINQKINKHLNLSYTNAKDVIIKVKSKANILKTIKASDFGIDYQHHSGDFNDFDKQVLLPQKQSTIDNALAVADVNNDGLDDIYIGNTQGFSAQLYIQNSTGKFTETNKALFEKDKEFNDNNALFFDADNDNDLDLYVASGNYSLPESSRLLQDRLYINDGKGGFSKERLPTMLSVTKGLAAADYDKDGDMDLFVGGRVVPSKYPMVPESYLLENRNGSFANVTLQKAKAVKNIGLVNDAVFSDYDNDGDKDLILAGEWMPITFFNNNEGVFNKVDLPSNELVGWFQTIKPMDFDNDGDEDYFVGNFGKNNKFHPSKETPLHIYGNHFDDNKSYDMALSKAYENELFPIRGKECSSEQTPFLNEKIATYSQYANSNIIDIYGKENIENALHMQATSFNSYYIQNNGQGEFEFQTLPIESQMGPILAFESMDVDMNGKQNVLGFGGKYDTEVETIRYDASRGFVLSNKEDGSFVIKHGKQNFTDKEVKAVEKIIINGVIHLVMLNANDSLTLLKIN